MGCEEALFLSYLKESSNFPICQPQVSNSSSMLLDTLVVLIMMKETMYKTLNELRRKRIPYYNFSLVI